MEFMKCYLGGTIGSAGSRDANWATYNANDSPPSSHRGRVLLPEPGLNHCRGVSRVFLTHFVLKSLKDKPAPQPASSGDDCHQARYPAPNRSGKSARETFGSATQAADCGRAAPLPLPGWEGVWEAQRERAELCRTQGGAERCGVSPTLRRVLGGRGGHRSAPRQPPLPLTRARSRGATVKAPPLPVPAPGRQASPEDPPPAPEQPAGTDGRGGLAPGTISRGKRDHMCKFLPGAGEDKFLL